jgi:hypothetical protein
MARWWATSRTSIVVIAKSTKAASAPVRQAALRPRRHQLRRRPQKARRRRRRRNTKNRSARRPTHSTSTSTTARYARDTTTRGVEAKRRQSVATPISFFRMSRHLCYQDELIPRVDFSFAPPSAPGPLRRPASAASRRVEHQRATGDRLSRPTRDRHCERHYILRPAAAEQQTTPSSSGEESAPSLTEKSPKSKKQKLSESKRVSCKGQLSGACQLSPAMHSDTPLSVFLTSSRAFCVFVCVSGRLRVASGFVSDLGRCERIRQVGGEPQSAVGSLAAHSSRA